MDKNENKSEEQKQRNPNTISKTGNPNTDNLFRKFFETNLKTWGYIL